MRLINYIRIFKILYLKITKVARVNNDGKKILYIDTNKYCSEDQYDWTHMPIFSSTCSARDMESLSLFGIVSIYISNGRPKESKLAIFKPFFLQATNIHLECFITHILRVK